MVDQKKKKVLCLGYLGSSQTCVTILLLSQIPLLLKSLLTFHVE